MTSIRGRVESLKSYIDKGEILGAIDEFYDDDVEMRENNDPPTTGRAANRRREERFLAGVKEWHWTEWRATAISENEGV